MRQLTSDEIKKAELNVLLEFAKFCEKNNLYYSLCGGTLLGAIRHKGFIPWDDDVDVMMPRPDYERLINDINLDKTGLPDYIKIIHYKNGTDNLPFVKFMDQRTKIESTFLDDTGRGGIWVDIFPVDGNPEDSKQLERLYRKAKFLRQVWLYKNTKDGTGRSRFKIIAKRILKIFLSVFKMRKLCELMDKYAKKYCFEDSNRVGIVIWGQGMVGESVSKKAFLDSIQVEFEGYLFNAISNNDDYLSGVYGDYMKLPPKEKRVTHEMKVYLLEDT